MLLPFLDYDMVSKKCHSYQLRQCSVNAAGLMAVTDYSPAADKQQLGDEISLFVDHWAEPRWPGSGFKRLYKIKNPGSITFLKERSEIK